MSTNHTTGTTPFGLGSAGSNQHHSPSLGETLSDAVEFRVIRPGSPVRRLRLTGNRYTFGSAEGCSIRLNDPALRPMHAVLIRDAHRILVRAYSVPLEVNGNRTTESILQVGDVMRMGAYRFELLWAPGTPITPMAAPSAIPITSSQTLQHDDTAWQERLRREAEQWRSRQSDLETRASGYAQRESVLHNRESELWNRSEQLRQREVDLLSQESAVIHIREDYASKQQEVADLLEENRARQLEIEKRDDEYQTLEAEYRQYADQAKQQLEHSQQQAETATEAVQRMRDQFAALNEQLEDFSRQQQELELSRDQAIDAQAESEAKRQLAEQRVSEIVTQLDATREEVERQRQEKSEHHQAHEQLQQAHEQLRQANEKVQQANENLQQQVAELQQRVDEASSEASQLRTDYEGALASVRQLELLVDQTKSKGNEDRQSWVAETEELRRTVEQISVDLANATAELSEVREANEALTRQLTESEQQRLAAQSETQSRPSNDVVESLSQDLESANARLEEMQREHEDAIARLTEQRKADQQQVEQLLIDQREADRQQAEQRLSEALAEREAQIAESSTDDEQVDPEDPSLTGLAASSIAGISGVISYSVSTDETPQIAETDDVDPENTAGNDEEGWPTYESESLDGQDLVAEMDSEIVESVSSMQDLLADTSSPAGETTEQSSTWDSVTDESSATSEAASDEEISAEQSVTAEARDQVNDDGSVWRVESKQSADSTSHLETWDAETEIDSQAELEAQDGVAQWQDESPEVSINEMIDDIEQSVDQVITDSDTAPNAWENSEQAVEDSEPTPTAWENSDETVDDSADSNPVATDWSEHPTAWESTDAADEPADLSDSFAPDAPENSDFYASDYQNENADTTSEDGSYAESSLDDDASGNESVANESFDHWSESGHDTDQAVAEADEYPATDPDEEPADHSLAEMLIRDIDASDSSEDDEPIDDYENTYVMSEFSDAVPPDNYEATHSWDHSTLETDESATDSHLTEPHADETHADETIADDDSQASDEIAAGEGETSTGEETVKADAEVAGHDSIEDYMNRLLQRVQGDDDGQSEMVETSTLTSSSLEAPTDLANDEGVGEPEPIDVNAPLIPRSKAPERSHDLSAMRELANSSARSAVARSVRIQARDTQLKGMMKLLQVAVALSCAVACYFFLNWGFMIKGMAIIAILVIAGILAQEALVLLSDARRRLQLADETGTDESDFYEPVAGLEDAGDSVAATDATDADGPAAESFEEISDEAGDALFAESTDHHQDGEPVADSDEEKVDKS